MFRSTSKKMNPKSTDTLVGEGTQFDGKMISEASLRIEGQINGDIECAGDITIGQNAVVHSNMSARDIIIAGRVKGDIHTHGKLIVTHTGILIGNIDVKSFVIHEGGVFQGNSSMTPAAAADKSTSKVIEAKSRKSHQNEQQNEQPIASNG
jgi:cytoskeletal protein CcmA (bactofilin family)